MPPATTYFSFQDFLSADDAARFFDLPHASQVAKVAAYLEFLGRQPAAAHFAASPRASTSSAVPRSSRVGAVCCGSTRTTRNSLQSDGDDDGNGEPSELNASSPAYEDAHVLRELLAGRTRSGFGAFGTESGFLPQKELSLSVAAVVEEIGHEYVVERPKRGERPTLNSRSFFFYWCHAEKQKLVDIRRKLDRLCVDGRRQQRRRSLWQQLVVVVDRAMCPDCLAFAASLARDEQIFLAIEDPDALRVFPPDRSQSVQVMALR